MTGAAPRSPCRYRPPRTPGDRSPSSPPACSRRSRRSRGAPGRCRSCPTDRPRHSPRSHSALSAAPRARVPVCPGCGRGWSGHRPRPRHARAPPTDSARSRSARLTTPTTRSPSSTGTRLMRCSSISATISSSGGVGVHADHVVRHHVGDAAAVRAGEVRRLPARRGDQPQPPGAPPLGPQFVAAQQVALGDDPGERARGIDDEQAGDAPLQHQFAPPAPRSRPAAPRSRCGSSRRWRSWARSSCLGGQAVDPQALAIIGQPHCRKVNHSDGGEATAA